MDEVKVVEFEDVGVGVESKVRIAVLTTDGVVQEDAFVIIAGNVMHLLSKKDGKELIKFFKEL